jgi:molecular chaperone GrpE
MKHKRHTSEHPDDSTSIAAGGPDSDTSFTPEEVSQNEPSSNSAYAELEQRLKSAQNNAAEAESLYKRMAADFENYRKRVDRERQEFRTFGLQQAIEAMLPALDDLDRAQAALNTSMSPEDLLESLKLVFNRIHQSVQQIGVQPIEAIGEHFDPQFHEPVQKIETSLFPDGTVMEVLRKGYTLNGKVIRPALVNVADSKPVDHPEETVESTT